MRDEKDKRHATISDDVILPDKTPTISETKTVNINLVPMKPGEPGIGPLTFTHEETSIELGTLRNLVKSKVAVNKVACLDTSSECNKHGDTNLSLA